MNLDDPETLEKIIAEAIDVERVGFAEDPQIVCVDFKPYSGWVKQSAGGIVNGLTPYKDGKLAGPATAFYSNGQKKQETTGEEISGGLQIITAVAWKPNGEKCPVTNVVNGNGVVVLYKDDGTEKRRVTYKDGKPVED